MRSMLHLWQFDAVGGRTPDGQQVGGHHRILRGGGIAPMQGSSISRNRNKIVSTFLTEHDVPWLWMVDDDMTFEPDTLEALLDVADPQERPIVGGLCFQYIPSGEDRRLYPTLFTWIPGTNKLHRVTRYPADSVVAVAATGAACLLVHRRVFEGMAEKFPKPRPWFDRTPFCDSDAEGNPIPGTEDEYSEDITFCVRAQAAGFPVHVATGVKTGHVKRFEANEETFIAEANHLAETRTFETTKHPTYVVVASKNRRAMLTRLLDQLAPQVIEIFVYDNGYQPPFVGGIDAKGWPLHRMWNDGLDRAEKAAAAQPYNVIVVNDDVEVEGHCAALLEGGLRSSDDNWISYPDWHGTNLPVGAAVVTTNDQMAGQTLSGWLFMLRGEAGLRFDEQFEWWYADTDIQRQVEAAGKHVVCVGGCYAKHLDPLRSTFENPDRLAQARADEVRFAEKWGVDPAGLWLAKNKPVDQ